MPIHFTRLSPELAAAALSAPVITPNERLAREVNAACNQRQIDLGRRAWPKPRAISLRRYLRTGFDAAEADAELLSEEAELLLWRDAAPGKTGHLAEWAAEAWALALAYRIDRKAPEFGQTANSRLFQRWAKRFDAELKAKRWITGAQLADLMPARSEAVHLLAFERMEPQAADHLARVELAGGSVRKHAPAPVPAADERRVRLNSRAEEISAAAQWARQTLMADGQARIGVVFPYLTDAYHAIDHAFGTEFADAPDAFDLSGGLPLSQQPVWQAADALLEHLVQPPEEALEAPARAPFLELPEDLDDLLPRSPGWANGEKPFAHWVAAFGDILQRARWGAEAGSRQFQALRNLMDCLDRYCGFTQSPGIDATRGLQTLRDLLDTQVFAPQRRPAPIQVLGYLETTGMSFTHLWVAGLSDSAWPQAPSPNPLIPLQLQRVAGVPRLDHDSERDFAEQRLAHWRTACGAFIASWSEEDADGQQDCSPLIKPLPEAAVDALLAHHRTRRHPDLAELPPLDQLEPASEDRASNCEGDIQAGTSLIQDQAHCPFRAWAIHRLKLRTKREEETFADALTRGELVHDAFFRLYRNSQAPFSAANVRAAVEGAVGKFLAGMPAPFQALECERITAIIRAWLDLEAGHPTFTVIGLEQETQLTLPGAQFRMRIDRVNEDPDSGHKVVIDYKTGAVSSVNQMVGERLVAPQLPMYALTDARIKAVLVAQVGDEEVRLQGWSDGSIPLGKTPREGWEALRERWREQVQLLIDEFRSGDARVHPHNPGNAQSPTGCRHCHLLSLCRRDAFEAAS
ncbi:MAG: PD-(D/E)XK nuclease family protein [Gammaproteobacteria bacterium]|nr:PD-(D/E)XK nuclease family protein [Gammaproteobacteria bacterium]